MEFCGCCTTPQKRSSSSTAIPLEEHNNTAYLLQPQTSTDTEEHLECCPFVCCSSERRTQIRNWKDEYFPTGEIMCETIAFKGDTRQSLAESLYLHKDQIEISSGGFREEKLKAVYELMTEVWKIPKPNHIVSVTGGARNFDTDEEILNRFKDSIRRISRTSGAWVMTGGIHTGVMKHVSDALKDEKDAVCIGIPIFGKIAYKDRLKEQKRMSCYNLGSWTNGDEAYLDSCHSHFILYDDGQVQHFGGEILFRAALENYIATTSEKPFVQVVLNGGPGTLKTIFETIQYGHKVVLLKGSGGAADHMAEIVEHGSSKVLSEEQLNRVTTYKDDLRMCEQEEKKNLFYIAEKDGRRSIANVLSQCLLPLDTATADIADSVLTKEALRLALLWQDTSSLIRRIPINKRSDEYSAEALEHLLVLALARGNADFVRVLLFDYEISIHDVLKLDVLMLLYGYQSYEKNFPLKLKNELDPTEDYSSVNSFKAAGLVMKLEDLAELADYVYHYSKNDAEKEEKQLLTKNAIIKLRRHFCRKCPQKLTEMLRSHPIWELFIWAVVCNLPDIAMIIWPLGQDQIGKALIASNYFGKLARDCQRLTINDYATSTHRESNELFTKVACRLLDECHAKDEVSTQKLILQNLHFSNSSKTNLEIAVKYENYDFVAHTSVQKVLTDVWAGKLDIRQVSSGWGYLQVLFCIFVPFFIPFLKFNMQELEIEQRNGQHRRSGSNTSYLSKVKHFYSTPVVGYLLHLVFHIAFVGLFSYSLIMEGMDVKITGSSIALYATVLGFLTTELYQITQYDKDNLWKKIKKWLRDFGTHNLFDIFNLALFGAAVVINVAFFLIGTCSSNSNATNTDTATANETILPGKYEALANLTSDQQQICLIPHTLHTISCVGFILRILLAFRLYKKFGQYYEMFRLMFVDLFGFAIFLIFIILAYGVFYTSEHHPMADSEGMNRTMSLLFEPWFHIYAVHNFFGKTEEPMIWIALGIYLTITNIVLLNMLIAVFNNTYTKVMARGTQIWRFNRYQIVREYINRCTSPPPLCILQHFFLLLKWMGHCCSSKGINSNSISIKMRSKTTIDVQKLCEAEKIMLSQFQCDRALHIFKHAMEMIKGKVGFISHFDNQGSSAEKDSEMLLTLKEMMIKMNNNIVDQSKKIDDQSQEILEQKRNAEDQKRQMDLQIKMMQASRKIEEQNKMVEEEKRDIEFELQE